MLNLIVLLSTIGSGATLAEQPLAAATDSDRAPVRLWMNNDRRFRPGDRVRLQVDADVDGYLLVLNYDAEGRVRVLFPLDPRDDARVVAGRRYEVRDGDSQAAFRASGDGTGLIFTAVSQEPWRFEQVVLADRWDYTRIDIDRASTDPEAALASLVQSIAGPQGFDYDVIGYRVYGESTSAYAYGSNYPGRPVYIYDDYLYCNNWGWRYNGCNRWPYDGGWSFGFGSYYGYSPYRYGYGSYPYGGYGHYPYGGYYPYRPGNYNRGPVIVGRPRGYAVQPRSPVVLRGTFAGALPAGRSTAPERRVPEIDWRSRARPAGGTANRAPSGVSRGGDRAPDFAPPARRSRPEGVNYPVARSGGSPSNDRGGREPSSYSRGGNDGGRVAPPARSEPSRREAPPPRSEPSRRDPPQQRAEPARSSGGNGGGHSSPPPSRPRRP